MQADIILAINEEFGSSYDQEAPWHSLFTEDPTQVRHASKASPPRPQSINCASYHPAQALLPLPLSVAFHCFRAKTLHRFNRHPWFLLMSTDMCIGAAGESRCELLNTKVHDVTCMFLM